MNNNIKPYIVDQTYEEAKDNLIDYFTRLEPNKFHEYDFVHNDGEMNEYIKVVIKDLNIKLEEEKLYKLIDEIKYIFLKK